MRRVTSSTVLAAWVSQLVLFVPDATWAAPPQTIRCESSARETVRCNADTSGGVTLSRQLSRAGCWYDETWGYDTRGVWVSNGCRADFTLGTTPSVGPGSGAPSAAPEGTSGITGGQVAAGAAAALVVGAIAAAVIASRDDDDDDDDDDRRYYDRDRYDRDPWKRDRIVRCESVNNRQRYCRVDTRRGVEVYRRLSDKRCRYGRSWGYDRRGIWVDDGCRADFVIRG